ncbi:MAG: hypothetical protein GXO15_02075 [Crenarchaeota archaeon]|nr:hypothetical protein [Thermoproteota archaeon]
MSMQVTVRLEEVREALEPLVGLKLRGHVGGPPSSRFPLDRLVEALRERWLGVEEYRGVRVLGVDLGGGVHLVCHFNREQPDDFCIGLEGDNPWGRVVEAAERLSRRLNESFTLTLAAVVHALQGLILGEEEEVEAIEDVDQVIEELLTWLPEYVAVTE